ncbi:hypothetical protein ACS6ZR_02905 [Streptococcus suis]|uniref:hypothetical protein n=1 Tax=Streptococcus suis TaxID=1307 RepID=UPI000CF59555|nr:hypothetical protein [Streptococcus suis]MCL4880805.1 hypothetical protein [Streptococcus suis]
MDAIMQYLLGNINNFVIKNEEIEVFINETLYLIKSSEHFEVVKFLFSYLVSEHCFEEIHSKLLSNDYNIDIETLSDILTKLTSIGVLIEEIDSNLYFQDYTILDLSQANYTSFLNGVFNYSDNTSESFSLITVIIVNRFNLEILFEISKKINSDYIIPVIIDEEITIYGCIAGENKYNSKKREYLLSKLQKLYRDEVNQNRKYSRLRLGSYLSIIGFIIEEINSIILYNVDKKHNYAKILTSFVIYNNILKESRIINLGVAPWLIDELEAVDEY